MLVHYLNLLWCIFTQMGEIDGNYEQKSSREEEK